MPWCGAGQAECNTVYAVRIFLVAFWPKSFYNYRHTRYMVVPCFREGLRQQLTTDAAQYNEPIDTFSQATSVQDNKSETDYYKPDENSGRGFFSRVVKYFHRWMS